MSSGPEIPLADQTARDRIRQDLDTTLIVEAAAGTGKTSELVRRMIAVLRSGRTELDRMVAVTFTDAAAGELKLRLRIAIEQNRLDSACPPEQQALLTAALPQLEEARIGTIHSFCADLLRERPVEAGVDPRFEVAAGDMADALMNRAFERWFEAQLADPGEAVRRVLRRRISRDESPRALLRSAVWELIERRDFPAPWKIAAPFNRNSEVDGIMAAMSLLARHASAGDPNDYFTESLFELKRFVEEIGRREAVAGRDYDGLEAGLVEFLRTWHSDWVGFKTASEEFNKSELIEQRNRLKERLIAFKKSAGADLAPRLRDELWAVVESYESLKSRAGCLDFLDLLLRARDLIRGNGTVRAELQRRFTHIFVDEFQDTDPLQVEILLLLASDDPAETSWHRVRPVSGKLFIVGDPKQSIYRFRRADVALYETVKRQIISAGGALVELTVSFRAVPEIQAAVNAAFAPIMGGQSPSQARYVPLTNFRCGVEKQPAIVALPVPAPYGSYKKVVNWKIDESLPDATAAFVEWLIESSRWTVTERGRADKQVPIQPRHVCILFRRFRHYFTDVTRPYIRSLEARHLPHLLVGGTSFHSREEVEAIRNALGAIERPEDDLAVFATLRGPLFAFNDSTLLAYKDVCSTLHPFKKTPGPLPEPLREVCDALAILRDLHRGRNRRPIADTIARLLAATRAHAGFAIWPTGEQALANVTRLMDMARRAERNGIISFRAFCDWLLEQAERGEASDAPVIEEGTEGVRIMTVHKAKGLEFPVVILADLTARETPREPSRWVNSDSGLCAIRLAGYTPPDLLEHTDEEMTVERDEAARVVYVAATRARDLLVVPAVGDERRDGWLAALSPVIYPPAAQARSPQSVEPPGCPPFGNDSVAFRPAELYIPKASVAPGLHRPDAGEHSVVWWDSSVLRLNVQESVGLTQQRLLVADETGARSEEGIKAHAEWQKWRANVRAHGSVPSLMAVTATEYAAQPPRRLPDKEPEVSIESADIDPARPHGIRFGTLVHAILSIVDLNAPRSGVQAAADLQAKLLGAPEAEARAAVETVIRTLAHPIVRRAAEAAAAAMCRREAQISIQLDDGMIVEGVVDLAFRDDLNGGLWTVVDYKTDFEIKGRLEEYRRQVGLYASAISKASGIGARAVLLRI